MIKTTPIVLFLQQTLGLLILLSNQAKAQSLYIPPACDTDQAELLAQNHSPDAQSFWLGINKGDMSDEIGFTVTSGGKFAERLSNYTLSKYLKIYKQMNSGLDFQLRCQNLESLIPLTKETSPLQEFTINGSQSEIELSLSNISWNQNAVQIQTLDENRLPLQLLHKDLPPRGTNKIYIPANRNQRSLVISAEYRILSAIKVEQKVYSPSRASILTLKRPRIGTSVYFEMGLKNLPNTPRYIVRIDDPKLIATARKLLQHPELEKIVFAQIERGHGEFNFDSQDQSLSPWSWHFSKVTNISDIGSTSCNGTPEMLEDHLDEWIQAKRNTCFWSYRILRELP